jgi:hypothetical protein
VTNNPTTQNMTKQTLGNRSFINQVKYSPKYQSVAIVGTNDANVWIGFNLGTGTAAQANWVDVTGSNIVLPLRPVLGVALDPSVPTADVPVGYAAVGGFNANTPTQPGHIFQVSCASNCGSFTWADKTGNLPDIPVDSIIVNPNIPQQVFAGTDFGVYYTDDITVASPVWNRFDNGIPHVMIWDMAIDRGGTTLSVWTRGRGAYVYPTPSCEFTTSVRSNFNGTPIHSGNYIWFTGVLKPSGLGSNPVTIHFTQQTITSANFSLSVPDATVTFDPAANFATTTFSGGMWVTTVPSNPTLKGNTFFSALGYLVPANLPGGIHNVTWSGTISADTPGVKVNWQWGAAVYTNFSADYNALAVKPVDDKVQNPYLNSDHAGTPETFKPYVIGGATGGGGANYTGGLSGTAKVGPCQP